jgi:predicted esterase
VYRESYPGLWEIVSPYAHFGQDLSMPIRLLHGEQDPIADPESSSAFNQDLITAGYDSELILFEGGHIVPVDLTYATVAELTSE